METKNTIIRNFTQSIRIVSDDLISAAEKLNDNADENAAVIATLNVILESMRSHTVLLQQAIDNYN